MAYVKYYVDTGFAGAQHEDIVEYTDEELEAMTEDDHYQVAYEMVQNYIECGHYECDSEGEGL